MTQDAEILNNVLSELAKLKSIYQTESEKLNKINEIINDENLRETWSDDIVAGADDIYLPYESEQLIAEKQKYRDMLEKSRNNAADKPQKKPIITDKKNPIILIIIAAIVATIIVVCCIGYNFWFPTSNSELWIPVVVSIVETIFIAGFTTTAVLVLSHFFHFSGVKKYREVKKLNLENSYYNANVYPRLLSDYERALEQNEIDCKSARSKVLEAIDGCIPNIKRSAREAALKTAEIRNQIDDGKFSIFNIRDFSAKQLQTMAEYLKTGRADTYKEALNLYISETAEKEYRDKMFQKEQESKKKLSAAERAAKNAEMSARIAERKAQEEAKKRDEEIKRLRKKFEDRCRGCKKYYTCGKTSCSGFVPK